MRRAADWRRSLAAHRLQFSDRCQCHRTQCAACARFFAWCDDRGLTITVIRSHDLADPFVFKNVAMATHYGVGILKFFPLAECNAAITEILVQLNGRSMRRIGVSRRVHHLRTPGRLPLESARTRRPSAVPVDGFVRTLDAIRLECWTGSDQNPGRGRIADSPIERFCLSGHREPPGWASSDRNPAGDRLEMPDLIPGHGVDMGTVQGDQIWSTPG